MNRTRKKNGFTLVELIVVLVILAILAALLIPALTGYIDKAKQKSIVAETRQLVQAIQAETAEAYGTEAWNAYTGGHVTQAVFASATGTDEQKARYSEVLKLAELPSLEAGGKGQLIAYVYKDGKVAYVQYTDGSQYSCVYIRNDEQYFPVKTADYDTLYPYNNTITMYQPDPNYLDTMDFHAQNFGFK